MLHSNRKYNLDEHFFDIIDSERKAYWLGFLFADGTTAKRNTIQVGLKQSDAGHLEKLKIDLSSNHKIYPVNGLAMLAIYSSHMNMVLHKHGLVSTKSTVGVPCLKVIPEYLYTHYWRGVFDGDGWITIYIPKGRKKPKWQVGMCGTLDTVSLFYDFVRKNGITSGYFDHKYSDSNFSHLTYQARNDVKGLLDLLYAPSQIFLSRKKLMAIKINTSLIE